MPGTAQLVLYKIQSLSVYLVEANFLKNYWTDFDEILYDNYYHVWEGFRHVKSAIRWNREP